MTVNVKHILLASLCASMLSACTTVKLPDFNMPSLSEFKESAAKLVEGYPEVSEAPVRPTDLRSSEDWDQAADALLDQRAGFVVPDREFMPETPEAVASEVEALKAQVRSYKLDDPQ